MLALDLSLIAGKGAGCMGLGCSGIIGMDYLLASGE